MIASQPDHPYRAAIAAGARIQDRLRGPASRSRALRPLISGNSFRESGELP